MEPITLTKHNAHRACMVRQKAHPEYGEWKWGYRQQSLGQGNFTHVAYKDGSGICVAERELDKWEVLSWEYEYNFEDLYEIGVRAFEMTSFTPDVRSLQYIREYESTLNADLRNIPEELHQEYYEKFRARVIDLFGKHSRCMSSMITGPARFPITKSKNASDAYDNAVKDFNKWRESYINRAVRQVEASKSPEERLDKEWNAIRKDILYSAAAIKAIDTEHAPYNRSAFVNSIYGKVATLAKNGKVELVNRSVDLIKELNGKMPKPVFTSRHKFWNLVDECNAAIQKAQAKAEKEDVEIVFESCKVVKCYSEDRLQIYHDEKPSRGTILVLKSNGFRWSPNRGCWQRQLTQNAFYAAARVVLGNMASSDELLECVDKITIASNE